MHIRYDARKSGERIPRYVCVGRGKSFGDPSCQSIKGTEIDEAIGTLLVEAVTPEAIRLTLEIQAEMKARLEEVDRLRHRQVERAQYEVDLAQHRYMQVDAANRLVAASLETDWNKKLRALATAQEDYEQNRKTDHNEISDSQRERLDGLAVDFPALWRDPKTPQRERKRMLGLLIEDVTLAKRREITVCVRFRGGATTILTLPRPLTAQQMRVTHEDVRRQVDTLLAQYTDAQVANNLNERGLRTGSGESFDSLKVRWVRCAHTLKSLKERLLEEGWLTGVEMAIDLGVKRTTLGRRRVAGLIRARICDDRGEWLYWPPSTPFDESAMSNEDIAQTIVGRPTVRGVV